MAWKRGPQKIYDEASLYEYAVGALARRMRSVAELKRLMRQKMYKQENAEELMEAVVVRLKDQRYLNDAQYAAAYSGFRKNNEKFGQKARGTGTEDARSTWRCDRKGRWRYLRRR